MIKTKDLKILCTAICTCPTRDFCHKRPAEKPAGKTLQAKSLWLRTFLFSNLFRFNFNLFSFIIAGFVLDVLVYFRSFGFYLNTLTTAAVHTYVYIDLGILSAGIKIDVGRKFVETRKAETALTFFAAYA